MAGLSRRALGLGLLALGVGGTAAVSLLDQARLIARLTGIHPDPVELWGFVGGEKMEYIRAANVVAILERRHGLTFDARQAGSVEMVSDPSLLSQKPDILWPASSILVRLARDNGVAVRRDDIVFNSPIVIYSWQPVAEALIDAGIVEERSGVYYLTKPMALLELVLASKSWADIGVDQLFGKIRISSTDPNRSNSGFSFAGLVANLLVGEVATLEQVGDQITTIQAVFERMGYKEHSSGKLWEGYLNEGMGGKPLVVGYESQMIGFAIKEPELWQRVADSALRPVVLYPEPTVFSAHAIISLTEKGDRLVEALQDEELHDLAWQDHGFRGPLGNADLAVMPIEGVPEMLTAVMPLPEIDVMLAVLHDIGAV